MWPHLIGPVAREKIPGLGESFSRSAVPSGGIGYLFIGPAANDLFDVRVLETLWLHDLAGFVSTNRAQAAVHLGKVGLRHRIPRLRSLFLTDQAKSQSKRDVSEVDSCIKALCDVTVRQLRLDAEVLDGNDHHLDRGEKLEQLLVGSTGESVYL